jgi:predicted nucleotide-binding protein
MMLEDMKKRLSVVSQYYDGTFNAQEVLGSLKKDIESVDYKKMTWFDK